ncbi:MAG: hypothetical protein HQ579_05055 [Candidatus Omnitrophica bacterium]|nr:hypothetical protein [Candidatus Omnitrophota bacterium]
MSQDIMHPDIMRLIEAAAKARGDPGIPREFIVKALIKIDRGEEEVVRYPFGAPSLRGTYDIAAKLYKQETK